MLGLALALLGAAALLGLWLFEWAPGQMGARRSSQWPTEFSSNGERIYFTGTSDRAGRIPRSGGPHWVRIHETGCADCHGAEGRGGQYVVHVSPTPPDIRWSTLTDSEDHEHEGEQDHAHAGYTRASLARAIREGVAPGGERLSVDMPRWQLSEEDMQDLLDHLQTLGRPAGDTLSTARNGPGGPARTTSDRTE